MSAPYPFIESPRFPEDVSYGSGGGPGFSTSVFTAASGYEQRNAKWDTARAKYNVTQGIRDKASMDVVLAFFYVVRGRATGFRYKDWADYELVNEQIALGGLTTYQITKTYSAGTNKYVREIMKPVVGTVHVTVGGNPAVEGTDFTLDYTTGLITFTSPTPSAQPIRVTCEFDVPVRFDVDEINVVHEDWQTESWSSIPLIELKPKV